LGIFIILTIIGYACAILSLIFYFISKISGEPGNWFQVFLGFFIFGIVSMLIWVIPIFIIMHLESLDKAKKEKEAQAEDQRRLNKLIDLEIAQGKILLNGVKDYDLISKHYIEVWQSELYEIPRIKAICIKEHHSLVESLDKKHKEWAEKAGWKGMPRNFDNDGVPDDYVAWALENLGIPFTRSSYRTMPGYHFCENMHGANGNFILRKTVFESLGGKRKFFAGKTVSNVARTSRLAGSRDRIIRFAPLLLTAILCLAEYCVRAYIMRYHPDIIFTRPIHGDATMFYFMLCVIAITAISSPAKDYRMTADLAVALALVAATGINTIISSMLYGRYILYIEIKAPIFNSLHRWDLSDIFIRTGVLLFVISICRSFRKNT
jgi:hypothetical protein